MEILIKIQNRKIKIFLLKNDKAFDSLTISEEMKLSEKLIPTIDELLKKNKLESVDIKKMQINSDQGDSFTTTRIAKAVANAWNYATGR
jgi:tRNA A37 threonylcarbamoyladenosine modification protein TsaB